MDVTQAVLEADSRWRAAVVADDLGTVTSLLRPDFTYVHNTGFREGLGPYLDRIRTGAAKTLELKRLSEGVRFYGDVALLEGISYMAYHLKDAPEPGSFESLFLGVWVRDGGHWRQAAYTSTLLPRHMQQLKAP